MSDGPSNEVFLSYRRDVGGILAIALFQHLVDRGVDVFYDIESIRAGQFDTIILSQIEARPYFVLVLTPGTLERCGEPDDWLHREIQHAVLNERVIVPVYTPNFDFNDFDRFLPGDLGATVRRFNAEELPQRWFKFAVAQLVEEFLLPISLETTEVPPGQQAVVERILQQATAAPTVTATELSAQEYFESGYTQQEKGELAGAIEDYSHAIELNPQYDDAFYNRGIARRAGGDSDGAIADYSHAIQLNPQHTNAYYGRGTVKQAIDDSDGAIADYSHAIQLNPQYTDAVLHPWNRPANQRRHRRRHRRLHPSNPTQPPIHRRVLQPRNRPANQRRHRPRHRRLLPSGPTQPPIHRRPCGSGNGLTR